MPDFDIVFEKLAAVVAADEEQQQLHVNVAGANELDDIDELRRLNKAAGAADATRGILRAHGTWAATTPERAIVRRDGKSLPSEPPGAYGSGHSAVRRAKV